MRLKSSPKLPNFHRCRTPEETLEHVRPLMKRAGITRVADITGLDRIGLPVWSSVVPRSRDILSVYNGKGATHEGSRAGAIMEAFERQSGLGGRGPMIRGSYARLSRERRALDPKTILLPLVEGYTHEKEAAWTVGHDLATGEEVLVPYDLAWLFAELDTGLRSFAVSSSNGLSAGNTYEEAVSQALCEIIERDSWTIAEVLSHWLPRAHWEAARAKAGLPKIEWVGSTEQPFDDDGDLYPELDPATFEGDLKRVFEMFAAAGLPARIRHVSSDTGIPVMIATVVEDVAPALPRAHLGAGAHPDRIIAATRALTEVAQSRAVDIQGVREDMSEPTDDVPPFMAHTRRVARINQKNWLIRASEEKKSLQEVERTRNEDTLDDIKLMLDRLRSVGLDTAIEVDLTHPDLGVPVTRVIVPGAESWAADHCRIGKRATKYWNANRLRRPRGLDNAPLS
ncbi:YcaO-like family protein [Sorangium sp. So ce363]|uniref:YcaO-like family protein n=1 Tax=unclassified Sorangium TaxID=2621164 RepID=UPI003F5F4E4C